MTKELGEDLSNIFEEHEEMQRISRRRKEIEAPVKLSGRLIFGMNHQGTNPCNVGGLESPKHGVLQ